MAVSFGCRSIFRKLFLDAFDGLVFNCHSTDLPRNRGAANFTWLVLHDEPNVYGTIHVVDEGLDSGDVLIKIRRSRESKDPYPIDFMRETHLATLEALESLLDHIENGAELARIPMDLEQGTYLPRLKTEENGAIDWRWTGEQILRFIRAFGWPYPGAFTFLGDEKITIAQATAIADPDPFHPFAVGLVFRGYYDGSVGVVTTDGGIRISSLRNRNEEKKPTDRLREGMRLVTPGVQIERGNQYRARY
jgi:methionyl-tRNA formyltransferase